MKKFQIILLSVFFFFTFSSGCFAKQMYQLESNAFEYSSSTYSNIDQLAFNSESAPANQNANNPNLWFLSIFIPGVGQMAMGETNRGLLFLGGSVAAMLILFLGFTGNYTSAFYSVIIGGILGIILYIWNIVDSYTTMIFLSIKNNQNVPSKKEVVNTPKGTPMLVLAFE